MNMQNLMAQAQKVQRELEKANNEIENSLFEGVSGAVKITLTGKNQITKVEIIDEEILKDKDMLEDMVMVAVNDALNKLMSTKEKKMGKYTNGFGGLF